MNDPSAAADIKCSLERGLAYGVIHVTCTIAEDLESALATLTTLALETVQGLILFGAVYRNNRRCEGVLNPQVMVGDRLRIHTSPRRFLVERADQAPVVFESDEFVVVDKPSGVPVHATVDNLHENLICRMGKRLSCPLFVTHRLDVATSGLLVLAKTTAFQKEFNRLLRAGEVQKIYRAVVISTRGRVPEVSVLQHFMKPSPMAPKKVTLEAQESWLKCVLHILSVEPLQGQKYALGVALKTGRTHQIRAQLAHEGFPIEGDIDYGAPLVLAQKNEIALRCIALKFLGREFLASGSQALTQV